ncbi:ribonuclease H family protein (plasmid) [Pontibacillus sp. ALD_SL1]|uniref:ribonuclease H1 domain-containing protein n=1 Tax=Pontibacillus sp. ALD_SL1 TaxID=2777185 RepID=UPI001A97136B|nr:ribonuclease H family protein [Pontibacillus sp. ALD_SL1]QST02783.1 ribonuclease H family protein [Pontibacillus sp. ALD_SL1]
MAKTKFYVVWKGKTPGIYFTWNECQEQTKGYKGAEFKSFPTLQQAEQAYHNESPVGPEDFIERSVSVDAACSGNPGVMEYRGVETDSGNVLFEGGPYPVGTNNIGEFLALVEAMSYLHQSGDLLPIYTDSKTAISWVKKKGVKTNLERNEDTETLWSDIERATEWLKTHDYKGSILKWETEKWGEVKADYDRK